MFTEETYFPNHKGNTGGISVKVRNKSRMLTILALLFNIMLELLIKAIRKGREIMCMKMVNSEVKLLLFKNNMIVCLEKITKKSNKKLLSSRREFTKLVEYKINIAFIIFINN